MGIGSSLTATLPTIEPVALSRWLQRPGPFFTYRGDGSRVTTPLVYYGIPLVQAIVVVAIALTLLEGTVRLVALGIAGLQVVVAPQILKRALG
jgi:hypothetical protein